MKPNYIKPFKQISYKLIRNGLIDLNWLSQEIYSFENWVTPWLSTFLTAFWFYKLFDIAMDNHYNNSTFNTFYISLLSQSKFPINEWIRTAWL